METYQIIPSTPTGYALNTARGALSIVVPEETTNLITNPSFETNDTSWTTQGIAVFDRVQGSGHRGVYGLGINPANAGSNGARYTFGASTALSGLYTLSFDLAGEAGQKFRAVVQGVTVATFFGRGTGSWFRVACTPTQVSSAGSATVDILRDSSTPGTASFIIDGVQFEQKGYATTYCDGDQQGYVANDPAYYWTVSAHASTSVRLATTRSGGRVYNLQDDLGCLIMAINGLGLGGPNIIAPAVMNGGTYFQRAVARDRAFTLSTIISGTDAYDLDRQRSLVTQYLSPWLLNQPQPLRMIYENWNQDATAPISKPCDILCHYTGGLEGVRNDNHQERAAPGFVMPSPWIARAGNRSAALTVQASVADTDAIAVRSRLGVWDDVNTGVAGGQVNAIVRGMDGLIYVGGTFTSAGGVANTDGIARYDPNTGVWSACGTGPTGGGVYALAVGTAGNIYAGGTFTDMGGIANTRFIARWNVTTGVWTSIGTTVGGNVVQALAVAPAGVLYAGGDFTTIGGTAAARIAKLNIGTGAWTAMGTGANDTVEAIAVSQDGSKVWAGGRFTLAGGVANTIYVAQWTTATSAWSAISAGANSFVYALAVGSNGMLYIGGEFSALSGITAAALGTWNGTNFAALGAGVGAGAEVHALMFDQDGMLHVGGVDLNVYGTSYGTAIDQYVIWNGSTYVPPDIDLPGGVTVYALATMPDGSLYLGFNVTGTSTAAGTVTIDYAGTAPCYPTFIITGPTSGDADRIFQIINTTTGAALYFDVALTISEVLTLDLDPRSPTYGLTSSQRGNMITAIMPGSNLRDFYLQPGDNAISVRTADSTMLATMTWRVLYAAIEHAAVS